jgi:D-beta-D-heptose 7-phosphate kinase/D-beta-D-heptose 1-phosphate adenosyltransferase
MNKILSTIDLIYVLDMHRTQNEKIVFTNGCFDMLHVGHLDCLEKAKSFGDILVVGINSDDSIKQLKGPSRPIIPQDDRIRLVAGLECVDYVVVFNDATCTGLIDIIRPNVFVKGGSSTFVEEEIEKCESCKCEIKQTEMIKDISTTKIKEEILNTQLYVK